MKNIGQKLKSRREELGISLEEMSKKTKILPNYLEAIESGNLAYFEEDISYLRYFLRFYCKNVDLDFEEIRGELEENLGEFNQTLQMKKQKPLDEKQAIIDARIKENRTALKAEKRKIDYSLISLIIVVLFVVITLTAFTVKFLPEFLNNNEPSNPEIIEPLVDKEEDEGEDTSVPEIEDIQQKELNCTTLDGITYEVRGWNEGDQVSIRVEYGMDTWMRVSYNGVVSDNPASKVYTPGETMEVLQSATQDLTITLHFGALKGNVIYINNHEFTLADSVKDIVRGQQIHFVLKGD